MIDWKEQAEQVQGSDKEQLDIIGELTKDMLALESDIAQIEDKLKELKKQHLAISQGTLPEAMLAIGLTSITHESGKKLTIETFYQAKIPAEYEVQAFAYLEETGNDSIIKTDITTKFGKGEKEEAERILELLIREGAQPNMKTGVHPMTLKAFVREQIESGVEGFPTDLFGVYIGNKVKVK